MGNELTVEHTVTIREGKVFSISPSEGMLGIEDGIVRVVGVFTYETLQEQPYYSTLGDPEPIVELDPDAVNSMWVVYEYPRNKDYKGDYFAFTADLFIDHTSSW